LIYVPLVTDIGLTIGKIPSRHKPGEKMTRYMLATIINAMLVYPAKYIIGRERPDRSNFVSFPSGHTSNAFVGAAYFWGEYGEEKPWLGGAAYANAILTGYLRVYNDKHWISDVLCGAGVGILSVHLTDLLLPRFKKLFKKVDNISIKPVSSSNGIGAVIQF
jgi:membrane-associated phospholipid phosphatase